MNSTQLKAIFNQVAIVVVGVLIANQVQRVFDKSKLTPPTKA